MMRARPSYSAGTILAAAVLGLSASGPQPALGGGATYTVENVGFIYTRAGNPMNYARINALGQVSGYSEDTLEPDGVHFGARANAALNDVDLFGNSGANSDYAFGINAGGSVAGQTVSGSISTGYVWNGTTVSNLAPLAVGATFTAGRDINDSGQICGTSNNSGGNGRAVVWSNSGAAAMDLGTLGGSRSASYAINADGQVTGNADTIIAPGPPRGPLPGPAHAFRYTPGSGMVDLGTLPGGDYSFGHDINNAGTVCGGSTASGGAFRAFRRATTGAMQDLGVLELGGSSDAFGINSDSNVVGGASVGSDDRAFLWTPSGGMVDLNTLIPTGTGWVLIVATDINDAGQIVGFGTFNGNSRVFRLSPPAGPVDTEDPRLTNCSVSPRSFSYTGGTATVNVTITDNVGVDTAYASLNASMSATSAMLSRQSGNTWRGTASMPPNTGTSPVVYDVTLFASDAAGNTNSIMCGQVTVQPNPNSGPRLRVTPRSLNFGTVRRGQTVCRDVTIENIGTAIVTGEIEPPVPPFAVIPPKAKEPPKDPVPFTLDPGESMVVQVCFTPERNGSFGGGLPVTSNDPGQPRLQVRVRGASGVRCRPTPF